MLSKYSTSKVNRLSSLTWNLLDFSHDLNDFIIEILLLLSYYFLLHI